MGNDVDLWEIAKIYGKWLKYLTSGLKWSHFGCLKEALNLIVESLWLLEGDSLIVVSLWLLEGGTEPDGGVTLAA